MDFVIGWLKAKPGRRAEFLAMAKDFVTVTRAEPGVRFFELHASGEDDDLVLALECYESSEAHAAHVRTPHFAAFLDAAKDTLLEGRFENVVGGERRLDIVTF